MKTTLKFIYALLLAATLGFKANAQAVDMVLDNPLLSPVPTTYPGTVSFSFDFYAELGNHDLSSDDLAANFAIITISLGKLDGTGIMPTGPGADLFNWTYNPATKSYIGQSKDVTVVEDVFYKITLSNVPTTQVSTGLDVGFIANLTPPGDLLNSDPNDDDVHIYTNAVPGAVPPVATADAVSTTHDTNITVNVVTNDTPGSAAIDPTSVRLIDPVSGMPVTSVTVANEGTYTVNPDGTITFDPLSTFTGTATPVKYTVKDVNGVESNQVGITVTVGPLPVTLVRFNAVKEGKTAQLSWATTEETNSDRFEIEKSLNGKQWEMIGTVASHGESAVLRQYTFTDKNPVDGNNLYRLRMVDKDDTFAYSRIQTVKFDGIGADLSIYPNPVADQLFVRDFSQVTKVLISDLNGRAVHESGATATGAINVQNLSAGMYIVTISRANGIVSSQKIVVRK